MEARLQRRGRRDLREGCGDPPATIVSEEASGDRSGRPPLRVVLLVLSLTLAGGLLLKVPCAAPDWSPSSSAGFLCYTDMVPLYRGEGLSATRAPYFDARNEYPVLTGAWMYLTALPVSSVGSYLLLNAVGLGAMALVTTVALYRFAGARALYFAAAPSLLLYAFLNWDLLALTLATLGALAYLR